MVGSLAVRILRLGSLSALVLLGACQASGPVYRTYYLPEDGSAGDATALVRAAEARCVDHANVEAQNAFDRTYRNAAVNVPRTTAPSGGAPAGLAISPSESQALVASRMASVQAQQAQQAAWDEGMKACMAEAGFRQIRTCVSRCEQ